MVEAMIAVRRYLLLLLAFVALPSCLCAHQLDEYLQATLVAIEPGEIRLEINLTPGVAVAERILALIDRDHDGVISTNEARTYADLLKGDLLVRLDQGNVELNLAAFNFPEPSELRSGWGIIQMELTVKTSGLTGGAHRLTLENRHLPAISVYLVNATRPASGLIQIVGQKRNKNQSTAEIAFDFHPPQSPSILIGIVATLTALSVVLFAGLCQARKQK